MPSRDFSSSLKYAVTVSALISARAGLTLSETRAISQCLFMKLFNHSIPGKLLTNLRSETPCLSIWDLTSSRVQPGEWNLPLCQTVYGIDDQILSFSSKTIWCSDAHGMQVMNFVVQSPIRNVKFLWCLQNGPSSRNFMPCFQQSGGWIVRFITSATSLSFISPHSVQVKTCAKLQPVTEHTNTKLAHHFFRACCKIIIERVHRPLSGYESPLLAVPPTTSHCLKT